GFLVFVPAGVADRGDRLIAESEAGFVDAAFGAAAGNELILAGAAGDHLIDAGAERGAFVVGRAGVARLVLGEVAARALLAERAATRSATIALDEFARLADELAFGIEAARLALFAGASDSWLAAASGQSRPKRDRENEALFHGVCF